MTQNNRTKKNKSRQKTRESTFKTRQKYIEIVFGVLYTNLLLYIYIVMMYNQSYNLTNIENKTETKIYMNNGHNINKIDSSKIYNLPPLNVILDQMLGAQLKSNLNKNISNSHLLL